MSARARLTGIARLRRGEDGFILLESIVAVSLITIILAALGTFTVRTITTTNDFRGRQGAAQLATSTIANLYAIPATDVLTGRDKTTSDTQWTKGQLNPLVNAALATATEAYDSTNLPANSGATAAIPTVAVPQLLNGISYSVNTYLGSCVIPTGSTTCVATGTGISYYRAVVAVTWSARGCGTDTAASTCTYVTSTLINHDDDPIFNTNKATPPVTPIVTVPANQLSTIGQVVDLQLGVTANTGVPPLTWQLTTGTLPIGLTLSASGEITGTPSVKVTSTPLTVTVTDAFGRTGSGSFTWTVVGPPTITAPATQSTSQGKAATLALTSTCPNPSCTFTATGLPAGLTINATTGTISGTPTTVATYTVTVTSTDSVNVTGTATFTWKVLPAPTIAGPGTQAFTISGVESVPIAYTCPTATCTIALTGTIPGLGLSTTAANSTNNTTASLTVSTATGTVYIAGTVQTTAVTTGTSKAYNPVTVKITDTNTNTTSATGAWTAFTKPTIGAPGTKTMTVKNTVNVPVAYTCPNVTCTITVANNPVGVGLSTTSGVTTANSTTSLVVTPATGTVYLTGLVDVTAVPTGTSKVYATTVTITDFDAVAVASAGSWTVYKGPTITDPGTQAIEVNQNLSLQMSALCPNGGCNTWAAAVQIPGDTTDWYAISISSSGLIAYNNAPAGTYQARVTVTDSAGMTDTDNFTLIVQNFTLTIPTQTTTKPTTGTKVVTLDINQYLSPVADGYSYVLSGAPSWLTMDSNGVLTATILPGSATDTAITVTVTSTASSTSTVASTFSWKLQ